MANKQDLVHLVNLIDDDTTEVRNEVLKELANYGSTLEEDLLEYSGVLDKNMLKILKPVLDNNRKNWLLDNWSLWQKISDEKKQLEEALNLIIRFQDGITSQSSLPILLDTYANEFRQKTPYGDEIDLANFLFVEKGIKGNTKDYHNPQNSNLVFVIQNKKGLPISLSLIYILIGSRLGFQIEGCNFPGHFLSKIFVDGELILVDGFHKGRLLYERDIAERVDTDSLEAVGKLINLETSSKIIIRRVLNNLVTAYKHKNENDLSEFFANLLSITPW
ncbi:MAG: transglutaminase-like domain-containing protein [Melioribacteraceae bacterium]|nr:transglutaminase-like domain-containing protein [Melioribacteraceae bacterium]MCF8263837.1 transglutaminase-like domain-containing protein [Melioribacteraceae bacterium]MCF8412518.1 transglutaminase-like domain-containing protein [Melioribacteraceae bacterium]MCF8432183.1 transglutaminase-like domain-containing protein [Melioribacteraceae bacterium]